jgi:hypothetical protein
MSISTARRFHAAANAAVEAVQSCVDRLKRKVQGLRPYRSPAEQFERAARLLESMDLEDPSASRRAEPKGGAACGEWGRRSRGRPSSSSW